MSGPPFGEVVCEIPGTAPHSNGFRFTKGGRNDPTGFNRGLDCAMVKGARIKVIEILARLVEMTLPEVAPRESHGAGPIPVKFVSLNQHPDGLVAAARSSKIGVKVEPGRNVWQSLYSEARITSDDDLYKVTVSDGECSLTFELQSATDRVWQAIAWGKSRGIPLPPWGASACLNLDAKGERFEGGTDWSPRAVVSLSREIPRMTYTFSDEASPMRFFGARTTEFDRPPTLDMSDFGSAAANRPCRHAAAARIRLIKLLTQWQARSTRYQGRRP